MCELNLKVKINFVSLCSIVSVCVHDFITDKMSTAFLVDNILNDKEDRSDSVISDTDSDATSDLKDSLCGSPESNENISPPHHYYHHHHHHIHQQALSSGNTTNQFSETLLRTYNTMIRNSDCATSDDHSDDASNHFIEMCCTKCGHFQQLNKTRNNNGTNGSGTNILWITSINL